MSSRDAEMSISESAIVACTMPRSPQAEAEQLALRGQLRGSKRLRASPRRSPSSSAVSVSRSTRSQGRERKGDPLGPVCEPDDIANAVSFFADEAASFISGQVL